MVELLVKSNAESPLNLLGTSLSALTIPSDCSTIDENGNAFIAFRLGLARLTSSVSDSLKLDNANRKLSPSILLD